MNQQLKERWQEEFEKATVETVRQMLAEEPELANVRVVHVTQRGRKDWDGPLYLASVVLIDLEKVKALVEAGANLNNSNELGTHWPSEDYEINGYFIEQGIEVNQPSYLGCPAIGGQLDSFFLMMEHGLDPNFAWPNNGETKLHIQARHESERSLAKAYALIKAGANVNAQARSGLDDEPIMENEHFVKYGRETPLHFAARLGNKRHVNLLLDQGADPSLKTVSRKSEPNEFAEWTEEITSLFWPITEFKRVLFEPYEGETALEMAVRHGHNEVAGILRERTA